MKKLNKRTTYLTNVFLAGIFIIVCLFAFMPEQITPISADNQIDAIYNGSREENGISMMFNVYENTEVVNGILDTLKEYEAKATFFVGGCWADDNGQTLKRIVGEGHEIGNHGYFHKDHKVIDSKQNEQEIYMTGVVVESLCGVKPTLFAPPSGSFSQDTLDVANQLGYKTIMWSKDTIDWRDSDENVIISRAITQVRSGDFILMHPKKHTLSALPKIISAYKVAGYRLITVSENL